MSTTTKDLDDADEIHLGPQITAIDLNTELAKSFMAYSMSTILGRALPDARDGMKPVHRRILYAMHQLGLRPEGGYRKCARVVGEVLGKFHPHGDTAVYDALVRMAQDFVMSEVLVKGHGNFGSIDNDPPAAMRYTECKLAGLTSDALMADLVHNTVDMRPNFDGNEKEPSILPARVPLLLLNGAAGIAVGVATNIPPHNLGELVDGTIALIQNRTITEEELYKLIPAPDFPTGGYIMGKGGPHKFYTTGNGAVQMRAKIEHEIINHNGSPRNALVITELPYQVNKASLSQKIAEMVNDKKLEGIADLRDESDRNGIRLVIELRRDAVPNVVQNNLYKKTNLQTSFSGNFVALGSQGRQPVRFSLKQSLLEWVDFRFEVVRRRTLHQLDKARARDHLVQGLLKALGQIDEVIELIRRSRDPASARKKLTKGGIGLSEVQAEAIVNLRLSRLTSMEEGKLKSEHKELEKTIRRLQDLMDQDEQVYDVMIEELKEIKNKHAVPRRSKILKEQGELSDEDLLSNDRSIITITNTGYIKRMPMDTFDAQNRGTRGKSGAKLTGEGRMEQVLACNDHDTLLFVSAEGIAYAVRAFQVPQGSRTAKGVPLPQVLPISGEDKVVAMLPVSEFSEEEYIILMTASGRIKRTALSAFKKVQARGLTIIGLLEGDRVQWVRQCTAQDDVVIGTKNGYATRFKANDEQLRTTGRTSQGVRSINLRKGDVPVDMDIIPNQEEEEGQMLLAVTSGGYGKRVAVGEFHAQNRGGKGVIAIKFRDGRNEGAHVEKLCCLRVVKEADEVVLSTRSGNIVRQRADQISLQSRSATGVIIQKLDQKDEIINIAVAHLVKGKKVEEQLGVEDIVYLP